MPNQIPDFEDNGNLPPGIHAATWAEFTERFGYNDHRRKQLDGLKQLGAALAQAGGTSICVDGSYVTSKEFPRDFDACFDPTGVDPDVLRKLAPEILDPGPRRINQKTRFGGEIFPSSATADIAGNRYLDFFQQDRNTGNRKGIVKLNLGDLS
jgi:hypothetical protein